ncbi:MAG: hypothetical protein ABMA14_12315 [Hyphomonadaceae bacterium]
MTSFRLGLAAACAALLVHAPVAGADPVTVLSGAAQLPTSGMVVDLPAKSGMEYHVSGSWSSNQAGDTFDTRDIVDEIDIASGNVIIGNWILAGYFTAGDCAATVKETKLDSAWTQEASLWGKTWQIRGGVFTFDGVLGRRPAAVLCRSTSTGHTLMLYHFLTDQPETTSQSAVMNSVSASAVLAAADRSYTAGRTSGIFPTRRTDVKNRGAGSPVRTVELPVSGLTVDLPDDGYFWMISEGDGVDIFDRLLPTLPELSAELIFADGFSCDDVLATLTKDLVPDHRPTGIPAGWVTGPGMTIPDGIIEMTTCYDLDEAALLFGIMADPTVTDVSTLRPLMSAIAAAAE